MTIVQLEYIIAVDNYRNFSLAAAHCCVTQPSLSMQIQKLEEELGAKIFDRQKQPVIPTEMGTHILLQARKILEECSVLNEVVNTQKNILQGELKLGIIPTLAPYLLPLFIQPFTEQNPLVKLVVNELTTDVIINRLKEGRVDVGLLVTPLHEKGITEQPMFYEEMIAYVSPKNKAYKKSYVLAQDIDPEKLWLLEEGHCFRTQIINLCELRKSSNQNGHFEYEAGSLETLKRMVEMYDGITILPEMATLEMTAKQQKSIRHFAHPAPVREISLVTHHNFAKKRLIDALKQCIVTIIPEKIQLNTKSNLIPL